ncbi:MAG TPA: hypothetical protein VNZ67_06220 [bacterium]|nr:hypothetical protein [bacterium]
MKTLRIAATGLLLLAGPHLFAADAPRPSDEDLFGAPAAATPAPIQAPAAGAQGANAAAGLSSELSKPDAFSRGDSVDNPLQIGGTYYQQWNFQYQDGSPNSIPETAPLQLDTYLDARPNDRLRMFVNARLLYDPTQNQYGQPTAGNNTSLSNYQGQGVTPTADNPQVVLDQAWLKFDIERKVFVTAGKQQVKWGTGHVWNPTDFLNAQRYNPLLPYDTRLGSNMLRAQVPLDWHQSNLYAIALFDNPGPASTTQQGGGAVRAETVLGNAELGFDAVGRAGMNPDYGLDLSAPLGPIDMYAEAALLSGGGTTFARTGQTLAGATDLNQLYRPVGIAGPALQASVGGVFDFAWEDNRQATLGAEYFYNELGVENGGLYPVLVLQGRYVPFYAGKHYAALYLTAEGPDSGKHTSYSLTNLASLSDGSVESRLDFSWEVLEHLTFGVYAAGHYGTRGGEFNFALDVPGGLTNNGQPINNGRPIQVAEVPMEGGLSLRMGF